MKKFWLACTMIIAMGVSSCVDSDKDLYQEDPGTGTNPSSFSTVQKVQVEIDYSDSESRVPFSIYDGNPLIEGENTIALKENVQALDGVNLPQRLICQLMYLMYISFLHHLSPDEQYLGKLLMVF